MNKTKKSEMFFALDYLNKPSELSDFVEQLFLLHEDGFERFNDIKDFSDFLKWQIEEIGNWFFDKGIYETSAMAYKELVLNADEETSERISERIFKDAKRSRNESIVDVLELICAFHQLPKAYASLSIISNCKGDFVNGLEYAKRALAVSNNEDIYNIVLGDCYFCRSDYKMAIDYYKKALLSKTTTKEMANYSDNMIKKACGLLDEIKNEGVKIGKRKV